MKAFEQLTSAEQQPWIDMAIAALDGTLVCSRVWSAWGYGTMSDADFTDSVDDDDLVLERAAGIYNAVKAINI